MSMERWTSLSSGETMDSSAWKPGTLDVSKNDSNSSYNTRRNQQSASESFREMVQALGSDKMERIRALIAEHHQSQQVHLGAPRKASPPSAGNGLPRKSSPPPAGLIVPGATMSSPGSADDEVSLTILYLESALGPEDMAELRDSMISVRRQSVHLDVVISSDMTAEELERSVETVKTRQDEVLELIFVEIMDLVATKLGIEINSIETTIGVEEIRSIAPGSRRGSRVAGIPRDVRLQRDMLKVPEVDSTGKSPSISNGYTGGGATRQRQNPVQAKTSWWSRRGTEVGGRTKGLVDFAGSSKEQATSVTEKKKKRRGCVGICSIM